MSEASNVKRILAMCRTKLDARTRQPWPDIQRRTAHIGNVAHDLKELTKALEHFHIVLNAHDLVTLMNAFPTAAPVNAEGLAGFDFRAFANALYPPESLDLGPMGAQHAVLPFMGRHNPFIQPVNGAQPSVVPAGKVEPAHSGVAIEALSARSQANANANAYANGNGAYVEAAPAAAAAGHNSAQPIAEAVSLAASARPLTPHQHTQRHTQPLYPAAEDFKSAEPHYASATTFSGAKAKSAVLPAAQASQRIVAGRGKGAAPINVGAAAGAGAGAGAGATRRSALGNSLPRRQSTGGAVGNPRATTSWMSSLKLHADANNQLNGTVGAGGMPTTGRQFLHTTNFNRTFGGVAAQGAAGAGAAAGVGGSPNRGKGAGAPLPELGAPGSNAERLYAIATGRRSTGSLGLDSTGRVPAPSALTVTYNRRDHERRHEYTARRPLTGSQKRHTAYPIEEALPHGNYQHVQQPRFVLKQPGVVPDPNFAKSIAAGVKWPGAWSSK